MSEDNKIGMALEILIFAILAYSIISWIVGSMTMTAQKGRYELPANYTQK